MRTRPGTWDDEIVTEVLHCDCYFRHVPWSPADVWLDIGAHIGTFCVAASARARRIIGFEPEPDNFRLARENTAHLTNVSLLPYAVVGTPHATVELFVNLKRNTGAHSLRVRRGRRRITVPAIHINQALARYRPNKLKVDCEGVEVELLTALTGWDTLDALVVEFHFNILRDRDHHIYRGLISLLRSYFTHVIYREDPKRAWTTLVHAWGKK